MSAGQGWIGPNHQLLYVLGLAEADKDTDGRFLIYGEPVYSFLGMGEEMVVPEGTQYSVNGQKRMLAAALRETSYGMSAFVIA